MSSPDLDAVRQYFVSLKDSLVANLQLIDPKLDKTSDHWERAEGGGGIANVLANGSIFERAGVNFSEVYGETLPPSATRLRPQLAGKPFRATGVSLVFHPNSPHIPTTHMNVRFFCTLDDNPVWWFGGGFDLTPYYPHLEDAVSWHQAAKEACDPFGPEMYPRFKENCDAYFYLPHREETRGVGGLFFDDFNELGFETSFALTQSVGDAFWNAYLPIIQRRQNTPYSESERNFQLYRRGRYVEFNLLYDRGTLFGIQSGGRTESILMSMPPLVRWEYNWTPTPESPEDQLYRDFLQPRDWLSLHSFE